MTGHLDCICTKSKPLEGFTQDIAFFCTIGQPVAGVENCGVLAVGLTD